MQNKANLPDDQMNATFFRTTYYDELATLRARRNKADSDPMSKQLNLADLLHATGRLAEAEQKYRRSASKNVEEQGIFWY
jgi:hypothetical protein